MLLVFDVQVLQGGDEGLSLKASCGSCGNRGVADGALGADGCDVAAEGRAQVTRLVTGLGHTAHMKPPAEVDTVQHLMGGGREREKGGRGEKGERGDGTVGFVDVVVFCG